MSGFARGRLVWLVFLAGSLLQQPGRTTWDTKLDLTVDPAGFLARSLHLWNPEASFGELQNQAYGYLFPQGPFFWLGQAAGVPDWVVQRLWSALLLIVAYEGIRYVARALGMGAVGGVLAGLTYALSARLLGAVGVLSGEILPSAVLPWAVLPLVLARSGRLGARAAGLWCGVAVLCMSGVNAAGTLATLPVLGLLVLSQLRGPHGRSLLGWWFAGLVGACAWWLVPLLLLGRYSPPFLDFIETASATTSSTSWANDVRGAEHWLAYVRVGDGAWWPGAYELVTQPVPILVAGALAAIGLAGVCHRGMPLRAPLAATALLGLLLLTAGSPQTLGSLVDGPVRELLDGPLAPFRNVHKFDPLVRLPLALGVGHAAGLLGHRFAGRVPLARRRIAVLATVGVVLAGGSPLLTGNLRTPGFEQVPDAWTEAAAYLDEHADGRTLVLPGAGFGIQHWGRTIDEPMQAVARSPWVTRSQVPLVPGPTARLLDTIERRIATGEGSERLADYLARAGISHVLLRRDLDLQATDTVPTERVELALAASPGIERTAGFGRTGFGDQALIDVYRVAGTVDRVRVVDARDVVDLYGSPDDLLTALEAGLLPPGTPTVIGTGTERSHRVVGDGYRRVERQFGRVHDALSQPKTEDEPWTLDRAAHDFPNVPGVRKVALAPGVQVTASSSEGYADELGPVRPEFGPHSALDGARSTEWRSGKLRDPEQQWFQVDLDRPVTGTAVRVQLRLTAPAVRVALLRVGMTTAEGKVFTTYPVPDTGLVLAAMPEAPVTAVRLEVVRAVGDEAEHGQVVLSELQIPGVDAAPSLLLPEPLRRGDALTMRVDPPRRACVDLGLGPQCREEAAREGASAGWLRRTMRVHEPGSWRLSGTVVARPGRSSARLFAGVGGGATVLASSVLGGDPAVSGVFAFDGNPNTVWLSRSGRGRPRLRMTWDGARVVRGLSIIPAGGDTVTPEVAVVRSGSTRRVVDFDWSTTFEPFIARGHLVVELRRPEGPGRRRPVGIGEVQVRGLQGLEAAPDLDTRTGAVCGLGPEVRIGGVVHRTRVVGTLDDVRLGRPMRWEVCDGPVELAAGLQQVEVAPTAQFQPVLLGWEPVGSVGPAPPRTRSVQVDRWDPTRRTLQVGAGAESLLIVPENRNQGWQASLDGEPLESAAVDGWQQAYVVPGGPGGTVRLEYAPDSSYRIGLLAGLVLALALLVAAATAQVLDRRRGRAAPATASVDRPGPLRGGRAWVARAGTGTALLVLGGPVAAVGLVAAAHRRLGGRSLQVGGALVLLSAGLAVLDSGTAVGRPRDLADLTAAAGVGLLFGGLVLEGLRGPARPTHAEPLRLRAWVRRHAVPLLGAVLIAGQAVLRALLAAGSYYWQDDFRHLGLARSLGLSEDYLVRDYSGHLEIGQYAAIWALAQIGEPTSFVPAAVALVGMQVVASALLLAVLLLLFGRSPWVLVPFAMYLFTPLGLVVSTWYAAGMQALPLQMTLLAALLGLVRFHDTGRVRWAALSLLAQVTGLVFWQKAGLILPTLLAVQLLVLSSGLPWRERWSGLRERWVFWSLQLVVLAGYVVGYLSITSRSEMGSGTEQGLLETLDDVVLRTLLPGLIGAPWHDSGAEHSIYPEPGPAALVLAVVVAVVAVGLSLWRRGRGALAGWVLVVGYLGADIALLMLGRGEYLQLVARDPRYVTDALPVIAIGVAAAFSGPRGPRGRRAGAAAEHLHTSGPWWGWRLPVVLAVAVCASGLVTTATLDRVVQRTASADYVDALTRSLDREPGVQLLAGPVPPVDVAASVDLAGLLRAVGYGRELGVPGADVRAVDESGVPRRVVLEEVDIDRSGPVPGCGWRIGAEPQSLVELRPVGDTEPRVLRLGFVAAGPGVLRVTVDEETRLVGHPAGLGELLLVVTGRSGDLEVSDAAPGRTPVCVSDVQRGVPTAG